MKAGKVRKVVDVAFVVAGVVLAIPYVPLLLGLWLARTGWRSLKSSGSTPDREGGEG